jgi:hypothetical protein
MTYQTIFSEIHRPHEVPRRLTALNTLPSATVAAAIHLPTAVLTQIGIGNRTDVVAFIYEINNGPVPLPNLNVCFSQASEFIPPQTTAKQY